MKMFNVFHQSVGPILLISKGKKIMLGTEAIHFGLSQTLAFSISQWTELRAL